MLNLPRLKRKDFRSDVTLLYTSRAQHWSASEPQGTIYWVIYEIVIENTASNVILAIHPQFKRAQL